MKEKIYDIIIIGGGAAGLFAAASVPGRVSGLILDKAGAPGRKLLMSGAGQCNLTHGGSIKDFLNHYGNRGKEIRTTLYQFSNLALTEFFEDRNVPLTERRDGKVFPASLEAFQVLECLLSEAEKNGFSLLSSCTVSGISPGEVFTVTTSAGVFRGKKVLVCTGGCSYPATGSDGAFFRVLRELDIEVTELRPGLAAVNVEEYPFSGLSGISVPAAEIRTEGHQVTGDLLFTHKNFSGPGILHISRYVRPGSRLEICYCPGRNRQQTESELTDCRLHSGRKEALTILTGLFPELPAALLRTVFRGLGFPESMKFADFSAKSAAGFLSRIFADRYRVSGTAGYGSAMVTVGGVALREVSAKTWEPKKYPGLYFAGEVLDVDGDTGGYNLQFAFSSARLAVSTAFQTL